MRKIIKSSARAMKNAVGDARNVRDAQCIARHAKRAFLAIAAREEHPEYPWLPLPAPASEEYIAALAIAIEADRSVCAARIAAHESRSRVREPHLG